MRPLYMAVSQEDDRKDIDLCLNCAAVALQRICAHTKDFEQAKQFCELAVDPKPLLRHER